MDTIKFIAGKSNSIYQYKNVRTKILKCCADTRIFVFDGNKRIELLLTQRHGYYQQKMKSLMFITVIVFRRVRKAAKSIY
jgi:hypothetical protein